MSKYTISGIQQIGIGCAQVYETWEWYRKHLGMDLAVFDEAAEAGLMLPYTAGEKRSRHAVLAMNYRGGSGLEIWQYTSRTPEGPDFEVKLGDLGINTIKYKAFNIRETFARLTKEGVQLLTEPDLHQGIHTFFGKDPWGNVFEIIEAQDWYKDTGDGNGGVAGCSIGVSDIDKSLSFYQDLLGYDKVVYDQTKVFLDLNWVNQEEYKFRRVLLRHSTPRKGTFAQLLGHSEIELYQNLGRAPRKIYEGRLWGDLGYIHLCFDVWDMENLKAHCENIGHPFTVDSANSFDMGEAAGRFSYIEDPDGTLIEFVETHKIPIIKKVGWYYDLRKRKPLQPLPGLMIKAMFLNRKKSPVWPKSI